MPAISGKDLSVVGVKIEPYLKKQSGSGLISYGESYAGYDFRLGHEIWLIRNHGTAIDPKAGLNPNDYDVFRMTRGVPFYMPPHAVALGFTVEHVTMPEQTIGICLGKSTYARCHIIVNATPIEPGWRGHVTLELINSSPRPVAIYPDEGIAQVIFIATTSSSRYEGAYQDQPSGPVGPKVQG